MPLGVRKKGKGVVSIKKDRLLCLARNLSSTLRTLGKTAKPGSDWGRFSPSLLSGHVSSSRNERREGRKWAGVMENPREVESKGSRVFGEEPSYLTALCSDSSKMEIDAARPFLNYCFGQAGIVKIIFEELLRWFKPYELPEIVEAFSDVFVVQGYDYPYLCGNTWTIGGPSWRLSTSWCSTRRKLSRQKRTQDYERFFYDERDFARKIMYLYDDKLVADAFCTECVGLICQGG